MTDDYVNPEAREKDLRNRSYRRKNFMIQRWNVHPRSGNYVFADINPKLAASEYDKSAFARNDKGLMTYSGTNAETYTGIDLSKHNSVVVFA